MIYLIATIGENAPVGVAGDPKTADIIIGEHDSDGLQCVDIPLPMLDKDATSIWVASTRWNGYIYWYASIDVEKIAGAVTRAVDTCGPITIERFEVERLT